jgi:hypothetical protein
MSSSPPNPAIAGSCSKATDAVAVGERSTVVALPPAPAQEMV